MLLSAFRYIGVVSRDFMWGIRNNWFLNLTNPSNHFLLWLIIKILGIVVLSGVYYLFSKAKDLGDKNYNFAKFMFHIIIAILIFYIIEFIIILSWVLTGHIIPPFNQ